jgi:hypothetical protein
MYMCVCLAKRHTDKLSKDAKPCPGQSESLKKVLGETDFGHDVFVYDISDNMRPCNEDFGFVIMCHNCGAWASTGAYARKLAAKC